MTSLTEGQISEHGNVISLSYSLFQYAFSNNIGNYQPFPQRLHAPVALLILARLWQEFGTLKRKGVSYVAGIL